MKALEGDCIIVVIMFQSKTCSDSTLQDKWVTYCSRRLQIIKDESCCVRNRIWGGVDSVKLRGKQVGCHRCETCPNFSHYWNRSQKQVDLTGNSLLHFKFLPVHTDYFLSINRLFKYKLWSVIQETKFLLRHRLALLSPVTNLKYNWNCSNVLVLIILGKACLGHLPCLKLSWKSICQVSEKWTMSWIPELLEIFILSSHYGAF